MFPRRSFTYAGNRILKLRKEKIFFTLTWLRWILALVVGISILTGKRYIALFIFLLASLVGFFENFISKRYPSLFRSVLDFFADKLLVNVTAFALVWKGLFPWWIAVIFLARDLLTVVIGTILLVNNLRKEFQPTFIGKISYFFQVMALISVLLTRELDIYLMAIAIILTLASGFYALFKSEFRLAKKRHDLDEFRLFSSLKVADYVTLSNVGIGLVSIVFSVSNMFDYAVYMLLLAVVFDYFDGRIAIAMKQQNNFGKELDSLADTVSFGVAPAIFGFSMMQSYEMGQPMIVFGVISLAVFLFCGVLRLARYNIMNFKGSFQGMPITMNGVIIPLAFFVKVPVNFYPYIFLGLGILMVSSIRIRHL